MYMYRLPVILHTPRGRNFFATAADRQKRHSDRSSKVPFMRFLIIVTNGGTSRRYQPTPPPILLRSLYDNTIAWAAGGGGLFLGSS